MLEDVDWYTIAVGAVVLLGTLVLANSIAAVMKWWQARRIVDKHAELTRTARQWSGGPIPVTILTGFLGSGKTTLLNHLLAKNAEGRRMCIIENELGSEAVDHSLLRKRLKQGQDEIFVMENGCICCVTDTPGNELERVLDRIISLAQAMPEITKDEPDVASGRPFDHLIIETTGMANPRPLVEMFFRDQGPGSAFYLDAVVTMVDAKHVSRHLPDPDDTTPLADMVSKLAHAVEAQQQVAFADVLLINKGDLVSEDDLDDVDRRLRAINAAATVHHCVRGEVRPSDILDIRAYDERTGPEFLGQVQSDHPHTHGVESVTLRAPPVVDATKLTDFLRHVVDNYGDVLFRMKGFLHVHDPDDGPDASPRRVALQGVHGEIHLEDLDETDHPSPPRSAEEEQRNFIVLIGVQVSKFHGALEEMLEQCIKEEVFE